MSRTHSLTALLVAAAAGIHLAVVREHWLEWEVAGAFFGAAAIAQVALSVATFVRPVRAVLLAGAVGSAGLVVLWAVSRTTGLPVGPHAGVPEPMAAADVLTALLETAAAIGYAVLLGSRERSPSRSLVVRLAGVPVAALGFAALVWFGPVASGHAPGEHAGDAPTAAPHDHAAH